MPVAADETNPGNQMLRKLGWDGSGGLGKDGRGQEEAVGVQMSGGGRGSGGGRRVAGIGIGAGAGAGGDASTFDYSKESLARAQQARYLAAFRKS